MLLSQFFRQDGLQANERYINQRLVGNAQQIERGPCLSPTQVRRVREYIRANLGYRSKPYATLPAASAERASEHEKSPHLDGGRAVRGDPYPLSNPPRQGG